MKVKIDVNDLEHGMFVSELDRPWSETPFLLQGVLIESGEDIAEFGGSLKVTLGLLDEFGPKRIRNTPISEMAILGAAVGAAATGLRPIAEIMYSDFFPMAMDPIINRSLWGRARSFRSGDGDPAKVGQDSHLRRHRKVCPGYPSRHAAASGQ